MVQAGIAASQGAFASYQQLQNVTHLYAINMQFNASQVKLLAAAGSPALQLCVPACDQLLYLEPFVKLVSTWLSEWLIKADSQGFRAEAL